MFKLLKWERAQDLTNDGLGAPFALPKEPVNLLMWSHYGDQYKGTLVSPLSSSRPNPNKSSSSGEGRSRPRHRITLRRGPSHLPYSDGL